VWHGCGSTPKEREASVEYAHMLSPNPVTLFEGGDDTDEVFWMMLGDEEFARADYWRWRHSWSDYDPRIWKVDTNNAPNPVRNFCHMSSLDVQVAVLRLLQWSSYRWNNRFKLLFMWWIVSGSCLSW